MQGYLVGRHARRIEVYANLLGRSDAAGHMRTATSSVTPPTFRFSQRAFVNADLLLVGCGKTPRQAATP